MNYFNPQNRKGFFRDWYEDDAIKLDYIGTGLTLLIMIIVFTYVYFWS